MRRCALNSGYLVSNRCSDGGENVGISGVLDGHNANAVEAAAGGAELNVVAFEVNDLGAAEDGEVFEFGLSDGGAVVSDEHKFAGTTAELLLGELVAYGYVQKTWGSLTDLELARADSELEFLLEVVRNVGLLSHIDA
jgi:hypothetical protein